MRETETTGHAGKHYREIDICRGMGIILVVLGHSLKQTGVENAVFDVLISVIYSFHMPLFFFLSGFVSVRILRLSGRRARLGYVKERAFRLLLPYFTVGVLYLPLKYFLSRYAVKPYDFSETWRLFFGENPNTALWFLYILFWTTVLGVALLREATLNFWLAAAFAVSAVACGFGWEARLPQYAFFFVLGMSARQKYGRLREFLRRDWIAWGAVLTFAAGNLLLYRTGLRLWWELTALSGIVWALGLSLRLSGEEETGSGKAVETPKASGTARIARKEIQERGPGEISKSPEKGRSAQKETAREAADRNSLARLLSMLGAYSMDIYILSEPVNTAVRLVVWNILRWNYVLCTLVCFCLALSLPVPISHFIIRRQKLLKALVLGM